MNDKIVIPRQARRDRGISAANNSALRILSSLALAALIGVAAIAGQIGILALSVAITSLMIYEWLFMGKLPFWTRAAGTAWLLVVKASAIMMTEKPWVLLLLLITICATDIGAWFFGRRIKSSQLWTSVSSGKTWGGHIAGMVCGALACFAAGFLIEGHIMPQLIWIGIGTATLAQYGDLTESYFKRRAGVKDSSNLIPGHGGFLDRFDGWLFILPLTAFIYGVL
ncbi:MAG: phosphatidate cytidylyltransferase [Rickettsiales bacterium]|jgi:phosphatidate cytidylyltransferase|nr:phosphatidate cytidylyltransferase [Rickettsiales bacterium]